MTSPSPEMKPLPCPWCGKAPTLWIEKGGSAMMHCENAECAVKPFVNGRESTVTGLWNRREYRQAVLGMIDAMLPAAPPCPRMDHDEASCVDDAGHAGQHLSVNGYFSEEDSQLNDLLSDTRFIAKEVESHPAEPERETPK